MVAAATDLMTTIGNNHLLILLRPRKSWMLTSLIMQIYEEILARENASCK